MRKTEVAVILAICRSVVSVKRQIKRIVQAIEFKVTAFNVSSFVIRAAAEGRAKSSLGFDAYLLACFRSRLSKTSEMIKVGA